MIQQGRRRASNSSGFCNYTKTIFTMKGIDKLCHIIIVTTILLNGDVQFVVFNTQICYF